MHVVAVVLFHFWALVSVVLSQVAGGSAKRGHGDEVDGVLVVCSLGPSVCSGSGRYLLDYQAITVATGE